jgi:hypothetical protein
MLFLFWHGDSINWNSTLIIVYSTIDYNLEPVVDGIASIVCLSMGGI